MNRFSKARYLLPGQDCRMAGFTLLELVVVIIILSVTAIPILGMYTNLSLSLGLNKDAQNAAQMAQECAEFLLGNRRNAAVGYVAMPTNCNSLPTLDGYAPPIVTVSVPTLANGCPSGASCSLYRIEATYGNASPKLTLMVVDY